MAPPRWSASLDHTCSGGRGTRNLDPDSKTSVVENSCSVIFLKTQTTQLISNPSPSSNPPDLLRIQQPPRVRCVSRKKFTRQKTCPKLFSKQMWHHDDINHQCCLIWSLEKPPLKKFKVEGGLTPFQSLSFQPGKGLLGIPHTPTAEPHHPASFCFSSSSCCFFLFRPYWRWTAGPNPLGRIFTMS